MARVYGGWPYNIAQLGRETTPGTAVAGTTIMRSLFGGWDDQRQQETIEENIGILFNAERTRIVSEGITIPMPATPLTYQQFPHLLEAGIGTVTPSGVGPYVYEYAFPTGAAAANIVKTYTLEMGNALVTDDLAKIPYCWVSNFEISGSTRQLWMMQSTWEGQQDSTLVSLAAATLPAVEEAVFGKTLFYVDDSGGTVGTTAYTGLLLDARISVTTGIVWVPSGDGNLYPIAHKHTRPEATFTFTYELEDGDAGTSFVAQERAKYKAEAVRLMSLNVPGTGNHDLTIRFAAKYDKPGAYQDTEGNTSVTFEGHAVYSPDDSLAFEIDVTNDVATLP